MYKKLLKGRRTRQATRRFACDIPAGLFALLNSGALATDNDGFRFPDARRFQTFADRVAACSDEKAASILSDTRGRPVGNRAPHANVTQRRANLLSFGAAVFWEELPDRARSRPAY